VRLRKVEEEVAGGVAAGEVEEEVEEEVAGVAVNFDFNQLDGCHDGGKRKRGNSHAGPTKKKAKKD
jgi:hypothetical protein